MTNMNRRRLLMSSAALAVASGSRPAVAQPALKPNDLKGVLTPLGGERAGNADGTIPAWTGGYSELPAGFQPGDPRPIPFADEKPLYSITPANAAQYKDKLCAGAQELLSRFADFRIDVYPTHRTAIAPQYVYDNTYKNAISAQISADGNTITGAYGGTPFPIPTNGHQVMWNHLLTWKGTTVEDDGYGYTCTGGAPVMSAKVKGCVTYPYYYPDGESSFDGYYYIFTTVTVAPPYQAGGATLAMQPINQSTSQPRAWQYLPGQRRTREAPQLQYDTPDFFASGIGNFDEFQVFYGPLDKYDFNLVGKKEMIVPYNMNKAWASTVEEQLLTNFVSPDVSRWELHRVWVVEMTVKAGKRNVDARRTMYVDEDTWNALLCDTYDSTGALWKFTFSMPVTLADIPCVLGSTTQALYDFHGGVYGMDDFVDASITQPWKPIPQKPASYFTPGQLAALAGGE